MKPGRAVALLALLFGPLLCGEVWARGQLDLLYRYMIPRNFWPDAKMMLLERAGCPEVLGLGSSVTNRTIVAELVRGEKLPRAGGEFTVERVFAFGLNNVRTTHLYAAWRHIRAGGCTPEYVFVEVLPATLNGYRGSRVLLEPFLDAVTTWKLPRGFAREAGIGWSGIFEAATWGRLSLHRLRSPLSTALAQEARLEKWSGLDVPLPLDGMIRPLSAGALDVTRFTEERAQRMRIARSGEYRVRPSRVQSEALIQLITEASEAGSRVILHSPPVTSIYREIVDQTEGHAMFCRAREEIQKLSGVEWYWGYDGSHYSPEDFMDWNHLNRLGGKRYVRRLLRSARTSRFPDEEWCRERQQRAPPAETARTGGYADPVH